jgi:ATP-dependent Zn protease
VKKHGTSKTAQPSFTTTAYHEAGHALATYAYGFDIKRVSIIPNQSSLGIATTNVPPSEKRSRIDDYLVVFARGSAVGRDVCMESLDRLWRTWGLASLLLELPPPDRS